MTFTITQHSAPDPYGRQTFTISWEDAEGIYRLEHGTDGQPVGYRRAQHFHASLQAHIARLQDSGHTVIIERAYDNLS